MGIIQKICDDEEAAAGLLRGLMIEHMNDCESDSCLCEMLTMQF